MKRFTILFTLSIALTTAVFAGGKETATIQTNAQCEMCKERIEGVLSEVDGVKRAELNLETKEVRVKYHTDDISLTEIEHLIASIGYDAGDVSADQAAQNDLPDCCQPEESAKKCCASKKAGGGCAGGGGDASEQ